MAGTVGGGEVKLTYFGDVLWFSNTSHTIEHNNQKEGRDDSTRTKLRVLLHQIHK
jgi:hypothetical protein